MSQTIPLDKIQVGFYCSHGLLLLVIPCRKITNSAGPGARLSATLSFQHVDQIRTLYESKLLVFKALYAALHIHVHSKVSLA